MSDGIDIGTHLASWGYCKGAADLFEVLEHRGILAPEVVHVLARMWADNMHAALTEKGVDPIDQMDVIEPLNQFIAPKETP